jgi:hypothetical protein
MAVKIEDYLDPDYPGGLMVVPDALSEKIDAAIESALKGMPDDAQDERPYFREMLLRFVNEHGYVPEFTLERRDKP